MQKTENNIKNKTDQRQRDNVRFKKPGLLSRWAAVELINQVLEDKKSISNQLQDSDLFKYLTASDRARSQRLALQTLRYLRRIDDILHIYLSKTPPNKAMNILRLAVLEICSEKISPHAVVDGAVSLMKASRKLVQFSGLSNAILRKISNNDVDSWNLGEVTELPKWLRKRLVHVYDEAIVKDIELAHLNGAKTDITLKPGLDLIKWAEELNANILPTGSLRLQASSQLSKLSGFDEGMWWVQDVAATIPVKSIGSLKGKSVLDTCAAPGGKTLQLASLGAEVVALDKSSSRLKILRENLDRTNMLAEIIQADFLNWNTDQTFDYILLDAPCTATGTIRRHPDLPLLRTKEDLTSLIQLQSDMIDKSIDMLKPSGKLIFTTCSLLPEEGEIQVKAAMKRHNLRAVKLSIEALGLNPNWYNNDLDHLRLRPDYWTDRGGMDGFFIGVLENRKQLLD